VIIYDFATSRDGKVRGNIPAGILKGPVPPGDTPDDGPPLGLGERARAKIPSPDRHEVHRAPTTVFDPAAFLERLPREDHFRRKAHGLTQGASATSVGA